MSLGTGPTPVLPDASGRPHLHALAHNISDFLGSSDEAASLPSVALSPGDMQNFATYVLSHSQWQNVPNEIVAILSFAIVPHARPTRGFPSLAEAAGAASKSGVCGKVWKQDELAYKCKTCERDPTCVVCVQCFKHGDHTGHDYAMVRTAGGCCDCGDVQAWRRDGFCTRHSGACAEDEDPSEGMPQRLKSDLLDAVSVVAQHILMLCCSMRMKKNLSSAESSALKRACVLLDWVGDVVESGDGIRRLVGMHLVKARAKLPNEEGHSAAHLFMNEDEMLKGKSWLGVMLAIDGADMLPVGIQESLHKVYFQLITDLVFKRAFLETFVENYERFIHAQVAKKYRSRKNGERDESQASTDIVENFTVQLFTVPALVPIMIRRGGLLDVLIDTFLNLFETCAAPVAPYDKEVPLADSAFANEYQASQGQSHGRACEPAASSSAEPRSTVLIDRHSLPLPFSTRDVKRKEVLRRKRSSSESPHGPGPENSLRRVREDFRGSPASPDTHMLSSTEGSTRGVELQEPEEVPTAGDSGNPDSLQSAEGLQPDQESEEPEDITMPEAPGVGMNRGDEAEEGDPMSVDIDGNAIALGVPITVDETLMEDVHGPLEAEAFAGIGFIAARLEHEHGGGDGEVIVQIQAAVEEMDDEQVVADYGSSAAISGVDTSIEDQLIVFEEGLRFQLAPEMRLATFRSRSRPENCQNDGARESGSQCEPSLRSNVLRSASLHPSATSPYLRTVNEARRMSEAAILGTGPLAHTMRLDWPHDQGKLSDWITWRVKYDLKYVLTHRAVAYHLVHVRKDLFRKFVRMISMAQGMNPCARRFGDHVPLEGDAWVKSFTIEIEMVYHYVEQLADAFCELGSMPTSSASSNGIDLASSRLQCIAIVRSCLDEWMEREEALEARSTYMGESFSVAHSVSVHLPLHRFLGFMVHHVLRLDNVELTTALSGGIGKASALDAMHLVKHPLRVQAFLAQVRAGMWRRNGRLVVGQSMFYRSVHYSEWFVDLDLFLQQCCAVVMGPHAYLRLTLDTFRIADLSAVICVPGMVSEEESHADSIAVRERPDRFRAREQSESLSVNRVPRLVSAGQSQGNFTPAQGHPNRSREREPPAGRAMRADQQTIENNRIAGSYGLLPLSPRHQERKGRVSPQAIKGIGNTLSELAGFIPTLVEDLLIHVVRVLSERSRCGAEESEFLRRKLVHQLCSKDRTHSQLYKACSFRISMELDRSDENTELSNKNGDKANSLVEATLPAIAEYIEPNGMQQGKYRLRDELWEEFDVFAPHLSLRDRCAAEVRHARACVRQNRKMQVIPAGKVIERKIFPQLIDLHRLSVVASEQNGIATALLQKVLPCNGGPQAMEGAIPPALHLVCAAVESSHINALGSVPNQSLYSRANVKGSSNNALDVVCEMFKTSQEAEAGTLNEYMPVVMRILEQAKMEGNAHANKVLAGKPSYLSDSASIDLQANSDPSSSPEMERRKIILRKKKEQQAAALAQMRVAQASFAKHIDTEGSRASASTESVQSVDPSRPDKNLGGAIINCESAGTENNSAARANASSTRSRPDTFAHGQECALCHDVEKGDGTRLLGLIGFHQKTRLPAIARDVCRKPSLSGVDDVALNGLEVNPEMADSPMIGESIRGRRSLATNAQMDWKVAQSPPPRPNVELGESFFLNPQMLKQGVEAGRNLHVSFCGHSIHIHCFDRYFSSLTQSKANNSIFEGYNVVDLDRLEFLCPVCRRLANMVLPLMNDVQAKDSDDVSQLGFGNIFSMSFDEWIERCDLEVHNGWERERSALHIRSALSSENAEDVNQTRVRHKGEIASTVNALRLSIINSGKAVLQKFGLQSYRSNQDGNGGSSGEVEKDAFMFSSYAKLPSAAISTVACAEIAARSGCWGEASSQLTKRSLGTVLREARAQISLEPESRTKGLKLLWRAARSNESATELDPFATFAFLFLLWAEPLSFLEAKNLVRLGFNLVQLQRPDGNINSGITEGMLDLRILLYLRRSCILVSSFLEPLSNPPISAYDGDGLIAGHDRVRDETLRLLKYFDIPAPPDSNVGVGFIGLNASALYSSSLDFKPKRVGLIRVPKVFQSLLEELDGRKCSICKAAPKAPALCLVCGALVCNKNKTCNTVPQRGRMLETGLSLHARECGAGIGVFLVLKITSVQIIREERIANWGSPYLDAHGEEDENLDRGKPLFLNMERYSALERLWLSHGFDQDSRTLSITIPSRFIAFGL